MIYISHRGNISGPNRENENNPKYISKALQLGFNVEIDVWYNEGWFLGHDEPEYKINENFLLDPSLWCHAKNLQALKIMIENNVHCFWHQEDDYTLTTKGYIWTYPDRLICSRSIIVCKTPEDTINYSNMDLYGICSDYVGVLK